MAQAGIAHLPNLARGREEKLTSLLNVVRSGRPYFFTAAVPLEPLGLRVPGLLYAPGVGLTRAVVVACRPSRDAAPSDLPVHVDTHLVCNLIFVSS